MRVLVLLLFVIEVLSIASNIVAVKRMNVMQATQAQMRKSISTLEESVRYWEDAAAKEAWHRHRVVELFNAVHCVECGGPL